MGTLSLSLTRNGWFFVEFHSKDPFPQTPVRVNAQKAFTKDDKTAYVGWHWVEGHGFESHRYEEEPRKMGEGEKKNHGESDQQTLPSQGH